VECSLDCSGDQARLTYSLVDATTRLQVSAGTVDANVTDALAVEDRVVAGVVEMLGLQIQSNDRVVLAAHGTNDASAYDQYLRGRGYFLEYHKLENIEKAIADVNRALTF